MLSIVILGYIVKRITKLACGVTSQGVALVGSAFNIRRTSQLG